MPDPALYTAVLFGAACSTALLIVVGGLLWGRLTKRTIASTNDHTVPRWLVIGAMLVGLVVGFGWLKGVPRWPPRQAFDRLLVYIFPVLILLELFVPRAQQVRTWWRFHQGRDWIRSVMHGTVAVVVPAVAIRILLHGSIYLNQWTVAKSLQHLSLMFFVSLVWLVLAWVFDELAEGNVIPNQNPGIGLALIAALLACSATLMLTGYVTGGAAAMPFVGVMVGVQIALGRRRDIEATRAFVGVGLTGLMLLVLLGWYFGGLATWQGAVILFSPALLLVPRWLWPVRETAAEELRRVRLRRMISGLLLVVVPLSLLVVQAKRDFDRKYEPLRFRRAGSPP